MKKLVTFATLSALMLAGCSNDKESAAPADESTPMPVVLGTKAPTLTTKASLTSMKNLDITVWGLAKNAADWTVADAQLFSVANGAVDAAVGGTVQTDGSSVVLANADTHYYPLKTSNNYSFFGCYPSTSVSNPATLTADKVQMTYVVDGKTDVLWGRAQATPSGDYDGYNATYFRKVSVTKPNLTFEHMLTRFTFTVKVGDSSAKNFKVHDVKMLNVPTTVTFDVADRTLAGSNAYIPTYVPTVSVEAATADFQLCDGTGVNAEKELSTAEVNDLVRVGESIMVPTQNTYQMEAYFSNSITGHNFYSEVLDIPAPTEGFVRGASYDVQLTIYGERKVEIEVTLKDWEDKGTIDMGELN
ncbi:MAG: fimbrillin family protein [Bacteroidaceae bacterium]